MSKEDLEKQIELLVRDDESNQQTIINQRQEIERLKEENKKYNKWIESLNKDNHRLNNIINELEKWLKKEIFDLNGDYDYEGVVSGYEKVLDKLQELKGSNKE